MPYRPKEPEDYRDEDWLRKKYVGEEKSMSEIGDMCDCSKETIRRWLNRHNIPIRNYSKAAELDWVGDDERKQRQAKIMEEARKQAPHLEDGWPDEMKELMSKQKRGEKNPMWQGGGERLYYGREWKEIRKEILKRDDHTCQACGHEDESNHVHHIRPVREFDEPEDAHFDSNLITLCVSCHSEVEPRRE